MARTAPVPNIPAIPGMNPGLFVLGGGGGAGGSGAGGGKGKAGKQGASGKNGGKDAGNDGKGANPCGKGNQSGCASHKPSLSAGDPVDPCSGSVFTEMYRDFELGGNLPLTMERMYTTASRERDIGFGWGWTHSFGHELEIRRRRILLWKSDGTDMEFPALDVGESAIGRYGYKLERRDWGYLLDCGDYRKRYFSQPVGDGSRILLTAIEDWNGNRVTLSYKDGTLSQITDAVGRTVRLAHNSQGRVASVDIQDPTSQHWIRFAEYLYDEEGHLIEAIDADGYRTRFRYDDSHLLTAHTSPAGLTFHFVYDEAARCIESWGDREDGQSDPGLAADLPALLADGVTRAKGIYHVKVLYGDEGYSECVTSMGIQRLFTNEFGSLDKAVSNTGVVTRTYDALGFETSRTDPEGATWITERDERGRPLRFVDPKGATTTITRNEDGRPVAIENNRGGTTKYEYDLRGNMVREIGPLGAITVYEHDDRGLLTRRTGPNGSARQLVYDRFANLVEVRHANGGGWRYEYDGFGYNTADVAPDGARREYRRSRRGDIQSTRDEFGQVAGYENDHRHNQRRIVHPDGAAFDLRYSGIDWLYETRRATGETTRILYNRDGMPVEWHNPKGEVHRFEYDAGGSLQREVTFDGQVYSYTRDNRGLLVRLTTSFGDSLDYEYDAMGLITKATDQDGGEVGYEWDQAGALVAVTNADSTVQLERNTVGEVVAERQAVASEDILVTTTYDGTGNRTRIKSSLGYEVGVELDAMSERARMLLDGKHPVAFQHDLNALETGRKLPGGGMVRTERDAAGRVSGRTVEGPDAQLLAPNQPQWVGGPREGVLQSGYRWSVSGELVGIDDAHRGSTNIEYDLRGRLVSYETPGLPRERYSYDANGNQLPDNAPCIYDPGDRLVKRGSDEYTWDAGGRLIEKRTPGAAGGVDVWRYSWLSSGLLGKVERPDGLVVELTYDGIARRLEKIVTDPKAGTVTRTRFVWHEEILLQEVTTRTSGGKTVRIAQRDYCFHHNTISPYAHADVRFDDRGEPVERTWYHYVNDPFGFPQHLVDARGSVACTVMRSAFGQVTYAEGARTSTPLRKMGQYCDEETGLHYNRWRYYDPATGRFLSQDPRGLKGGANQYLAGTNPFRYDDPFGLTDESDRTAQLKQGDGSFGKDCVAVGKLDDGTTIITRNSDSKMPSPGMRDGSDWPGQRKKGDNIDGAIEQGEFVPTKGTGDKSCDHAEQRMIRHAEEKGKKITSVSATNNCCDKCKAKLIEHNSDIVITDPNGTQVHP